MRDREGGGARSWHEGALARWREGRKKAGKERGRERERRIGDGLDYDEWMKREKEREREAERGREEVLRRMCVRVRK